MDCLKNFVGLSYGLCGGTASLSGLYLNQVPGIDIQEIDGIASSDQITSSGLWNDIQTMAAQTFKEDVINEFGKRYKLRQILQTVDIGKIINTSYLTSGTSSHGITLEMYEPSSQCIGSNLSQLYIQDLNFYWYGTASTPSFTVDFVDVDLNTVEYTITVNGQSGWNNVWIDKSFVAQRINILVSGNFTDYVKLDINDFFLDNFNPHNFNYSNGWLNYNWGQSCGINSRLRGIGNNITGQNTYGLSVRFSTKCTWDAIVCANKRHFVSAWQYCLAIEFLNYRISSNRLNRYTTIALDKASNLQKSLLLKYRGGKDELNGTNYPGKLQNAIESIEVNIMDGCIVPNDYIMWRQSV
jgi:hypothetical protein